MSHTEPKTRQEKKGNKYKEPYNNKSLRIQEELRNAKQSKSNEKTNEKTNQKTNRKNKKK
jgi:hypothetical protein